MAAKVRIVLVDDHPVLRRGLIQVIEGHPSLQVVAEAGDGEAALTQIEQLQPNIAVLDIDMPKLDGFAVMREIRRRQLPVDVVILTLHSDEGLFNEAMDLGAKGYILKETAVSDIVSGIRAVAAGQHYVTSSLTSHLVRHRSRVQAFAQNQPKLADLTATERRILAMIARGQSSKEIAGELFIHYRTVENHRTSISQKLGLHGHNAVLKFALEHKAEL
jgi:DNA-binding NarL/FixJ family response regulator